MDAVLQGKIFDRVFSMMINERDFIIHPDSFRPEQGTFNGNGRLSRPQSQRAFDIETPDQIYTRVPTFSLDGKLQLGNTFVKAEIKNQYRILKNYSDSLDPDSTQIYNYTVEIALLPGMIQEND